MMAKHWFSLLLPATGLILLTGCTPHMSRGQIQDSAEETLQLYSTGLKAWTDDALADRADLPHVDPVIKQLTAQHHRLLEFKDDPRQRTVIALNAAYTNALYNLRQGNFSGYYTYRDIANPPLHKLQTQLGHLKNGPDTALSKRYQRAETFVLHEFNTKYFIHHVGNDLRLH